MITKAHITRRASDENMPAKTVERDYVIAHIVAAVASLTDDSKLVFKGGTALRLCHFEHYRYSADLDFSMLDGTKAEGLALIAKALSQPTGDTMISHELTDETPPRIGYVGPLGRRRTLKLDLSDDEYVIHTEHRPLLKRWDDLPTGVTVHVYTLLEVAAEKLRCVLQRLQCRDVFDLHLLFEAAGVDVIEAAQLFKPKAKHRGFDPESFAQRYNDRVPQYNKRWEQELAEHVVGRLPHFDAWGTSHGRVKRSGSTCEITSRVGCSDGQVPSPSCRLASRFHR